MKKVLPLLLISLLAGNLYAQDDEKLQISGSVDTYYKYDFSKFKTEDGSSNIPTYFANEQNSISLGMINLIAKKSVGKASFVGDLSFGPRGQNASLLSGSIPNSSDGNSFHIQNLYVSYQFTDQFSMTAGYMGTFIGYEIISPTGNFNYSTSYLFSSGPFQNAGIKANYTFNDKVGLMVGLFNDWNVYQDFNGVSDFGAQLSLAPVEGWNAYLNFLTGYPSGTIYDLTTSYELGSGLKLGLNAADYSASDEDAGGYSGGALYVQQALSEAVTLGVRGEYFKRKDVVEDAITIEGAKTTAFTVSANIYAGPITLIPEIRFDNNSDAVFFDSSNAATKNASQFSIAAVYAF
jgi:hypothetical protein